MNSLYILFLLRGENPAKNAEGKERRRGQKEGKKTRKVKEKKSNCITERPDVSCIKSSRIHTYIATWYLEIKPTSLESPALAGKFLTTSATWEAPFLNRPSQGPLLVPTGPAFSNMLIFPTRVAREKE